MQSSAGFMTFIGAVELIKTTQGRIYKIVVNAYIKCDNVPILWKIFFVQIANGRGCVANRFIQRCRERDICNFNGCKSKE